MTEQGARPGRRRRLLIGAFLGLLLAGLGTAAAYALSTHTTQAARGTTTSGSATQQTTSQTGTQRNTTSVHQATTAQTTTAHHHGKGKGKGKGNRPGGTRTTSTTTTTGGRPNNKPSKPVTISDAFALGYVNPRTWTKVMYGSNVSLVENGGHLQLTVGASAAPSGPQNQIDLHVATQCAFPDDFDARVHYKLLEWPDGDNINVGLTTKATGAVMRDNSSQSDDQYTSWIGSNAPVSIPFSASGGTIRIARVRNTETTYFWHGSRWHRLASARQIGPAVIALQAVSDGQNPFGGQELKVAFDNFRVTGMNPDCQ